MARPNYFKLWMEYMGFNQKQVAKAGETIGIGARNTASRRYTGEMEETETERLAMSARAAGLRPWSPSYHSHLTAIKAVADLIDEKAGDIRSASKGD